MNLLFRNKPWLVNSPLRWVAITMIIAFAIAMLPITIPGHFILRFFGLNGFFIPNNKGGFTYDFTSFFKSRVDKPFPLG